MAELITHKHPGGRECTFMNGQWRYGAGGKFICAAVHGDAESPDRGEFGMPGLGDSDIITHTPEWTAGTGRLLRVMNKGWGFERNTFKVEHSDGKGQSLEMPSDDAVVIFNSILPELLVTFLEKNQKYKEVEDGYDLGAKGIVPDLNRKLGIIKSRIWDGAESIGETTDEVAMDMIGHLLLFLAKRRYRGQ